MLFDELYQTSPSSDMNKKSSLVSLFLLVQFRLEELKSDDVYYINAFMKYIEYLESKLKKTNESNRVD